MRSARLWIAAAAACALVACGEKVQTIPAGGAQKADSVPWQITDNGYLSPGWKPGDEASWNAHLTERTQGQNDYSPRR